MGKKCANCIVDIHELGKYTGMMREWISAKKWRIARERLYLIVGTIYALRDHGCITKKEEEQLRELLDDVEYGIAKKDPDAAAWLEDMDAVAHGISRRLGYEVCQKEEG